MKAIRLRLEITGAVQGVGFRPFVYRIARDLRLGGWVRNSTQGVEIEIEGEGSGVSEFLDRLQTESPPHAVLREMRTGERPLAGEERFEIHDSLDDPGEAPGEILPDIATCGDCLREIFDPGDRRYLYPFTNCTACGPRYSIVRALPYDRVNTTMREFEMCQACRAEYENPGDRRFHAQPNACPDCGPRVEFEGAQDHEAVKDAAEAIRAGRIVAVKGIGGFHLFADARNGDSIARLRERKQRPDKPLAVMFPSLDAARSHCLIGESEAALLTSPAAPIVLTGRRSAADLPNELAPGNPRLGVFLPYSPLHHILLREIGFPVVATSGNLSDEPICIENDEAKRRLGRIADAFLLHDRPIARAVDDSVMQVMGGRNLMVRRSRGFAPAPVTVSIPQNAPPMLAFGGDLKNAIAVADGGNVFLSQHHGDLANAAAQDALAEHVVDLPGLCRVKPRVAVCDLHPGYHGTALAEKSGLPVERVQHHHAHIAACLAEHQIEEKVLGVSWDGTGYGVDGMIWGGEFLMATLASFERLAWLRPFRLPGGEQAVREPRRAALGLLHEAEIEVEDTGLAAAFEGDELRVLEGMLANMIQVPLTSSAGRLFDAVAALAGIRYRSSFEGQAAMELEFEIAGEDNEGGYPISIEGPGPIDWAPAVRALLEDVRGGASPSTVSARFHQTMVEIIVAIAKLAGRKKVALSGGCFQNTWLTERAILRLHEEGFEPIWHRRVPPNDGGLALGQIVVAARKLAAES